MLHIILVILKIAGILLAAVLLLLMLVILLFLFVPLRYELTARRVGEETFVRGGVSWLCRLIRWKVSFEQPGGVKMCAKALWITLFQRPDEAKESGAKRKKRAPSGKKAAGAPQERRAPKRVTQKEAPVPHETPELPPVPPEAVQPEAAQPPEQPSTAPRPSAGAVPPSGDRLTAAPPKDAADSGFPDASSEAESPGNPAEIPADDAPGRRRNPFTKIKDVLHRISALLQSVINFLKGIPDKLRNIARTVSDLQSKAEHYLDIWNSREMQTLKKDLFGYIRYFLHHIRPRKAKGYLTYGFTDPSITGQLTGVLYVLRPTAFAGLELRPVFETELPVLEGDLYLKGHIRAVHVVYIGLKLLFDKNLKYIRKRLKE